MYIPLAVCVNYIYMYFNCFLLFHSLSFLFLFYFCPHLQVMPAIVTILHLQQWWTPQLDPGLTLISDLWSQTSRRRHHNGHFAHTSFCFYFVSCNDNGLWNGVIYIAAFVNTCICNSDTFPLAIQLFCYIYLKKKCHDKHACCGRCMTVCSIKNNVEDRCGDGCDQDNRTF